MDNVTFKHSGKIGPMGLPLLIAVGLVATVALSVAYAFAIHYIPFIYVDILVTIGLGMGIGWVLGWAGRAGHVRNLPVMLGAGLVFGALAEYLGWVGAIFILSEFETIVWHPQQILAVIQILGEQGLWTVKSLTPTGWALWACWIVEALIIIGCAAWYARERIAELAYCEETGSWADKKEVFGPFTAVTAADARNAIRTGDYGPFLDLRRVADASNGFSRVTMCSSRKNPDFVTLTLEIVTITGKGKKQKSNVKRVVRNVVSTPEINRMLLEHWAVKPAGATA